MLYVIGVPGEVPGEPERLYVQRNNWTDDIEQAIILKDLRLAEAEIACMSDDDLALEPMIYTASIKVVGNAGSIIKPKEIT